MAGAGTKKPGRPKGSKNKPSGPNRLTGILDSTVETGPAGNGEGREKQLEAGTPYKVEVKIKGVAPILFHRYDIASVDSKSKAAKGSKQKKTDDVESYVYRHKNGNLGVPGVNMKSAIIEAAKFESDPRSKRKSAKDLMRAAIVIEEEIMDLGVKTWAYLDQRPVKVMMARIARSRPALEVGWELEFTINILQPEYVTPEWLKVMLERAGSFCGLCDFRPDFGRFQCIQFQVIDLS